MAQIAIERQGAVVVAAIGNPPLGYMNEGTVTELTALLDDVEADDTARAVVLTGGQPDVFIRHYDVGELEARARAMAAKGLSFDLSRTVPESPYLVCLGRIEAMAKPFVAAINGTAMGGGFELALACDLRIAQDGPYWLGLPEINIGLLPGAGGTQRLPRLIGEARALQLLALGRTLSPSEAADWGLVSECVKADALGRAIEIAGQLAAKPPRAFANIKRLVRGALGRPLADGLAEERTLFCDLMVDRETIDLMAAMNAGRRDIRDP